VTGRVTDEAAAAFTIELDGTVIEVEPGQSVAAALIAAGVRSWRRTRVEDRPRGAFCGIGICFDCLATINGVPNRRACLVEARPGDVVTTQAGTGIDDRAV
jgi:hypothetical protein